MTSLHQAIADNLILDPETGEWFKEHCGIFLADPPLYDSWRIRKQATNTDFDNMARAQHKPKGTDGP